MAFQSGAFQAGAFQGAGSNRLTAVEAGEDTFAGSAVSSVSGNLGAIEEGSDVASGSLSSLLAASLAAVETGSDTFVGVGPLALLHAVESGSDSFSGFGDSTGQIIVTPRDVSGGTAYLIELQAAHRVTGAAKTFYFSSDGFNTLPTDAPANQHYEGRIKSPGNYDRALFSNGTTSGEVSVGFGFIELNNAEGSLDYLRDYAFDGYSLRILTISRLNPVYSEAKRIFSGTAEQVELSWQAVKVLIRDRLAELDVAMQTVTFAGTTTSGGMNEAEGSAEDLKGKPKPLTYGAPAQVVPATANGFDLIYAAGADGLASFTEVRDKGVPIAFSGQNYTTVAALRSATIPEGQYATALNLGLFRLKAKPVGQVTCRPVYGAAAANRTAAQLTKQILLKKGFVENVHFLAKDVAALDALNSAEIGYFVGTEEEKALESIRKILGSIGAALVPDRLGVFRMLRLDPPSGYPVLTLTKAELLESSGQAAIRQMATGDDGRGVAAWKVTTKYRKNWSVMNDNELSQVLTDTAYRAFAIEEWRTAVAKNEAVKAIHKLSPELTYETYLISEAAALAEANRLLAMHSVRRDRFQVTIRGYLAEVVDLASVVRLQLNRFGLNDGKDFSCIGISENYQTGNTVLDLWG